MRNTSLCHEMQKHTYESEWWWVLGLLEKNTQERYGAQVLQGLLGRTWLWKFWIKSGGVLLNSYELLANPLHCELLMPEERQRHDPQKGAEQIHNCLDWLNTPAPNKLQQMGTFVSLSDGHKGDLWWIWGLSEQAQDGRRSPDGCMNYTIHQSCKLKGNGLKEQVVGR